ncbi:MAG: alcohol dehydrogenase catalytic domain-containing protein, partial [Mucilaginibacter polytrichastri]|nr:alcohol dehydrogenase catalytic domain-containing protein [Mucilaginibacter polytrichastri]
MRTLVCTTPFHFDYTDTQEPVPEKDTAIIAIKRIGICGTDLHAFEGTQPYFSYPRILGHELAGELVAFDHAPGFSVGEKVTILPYFHCGNCIACRAGLPNCCTWLQVCGVHTDGGMREYFRVPTSALVHGEGLSYDELALVEPLAIGAHGVRRAGIQPGEFVLVSGAGPIGLAVMEFARIAGAQVIAVDVNERRLNFCTEKIGVKTALNARDADIMDQISAVTNGDMPTVVIDA